MIGKCPLQLLAAVGLALIPGWGQAQVDTTSLARDTHIFRRLFHSQGCLPITSRGELFEHPSETVLVVLGDISMLDEIDSVAYVKRGGSLLIATDRQPKNRREGQQLAAFGVSLFGVGSRGAVTVSPNHGYHRLADCPFVVPTDSELPLFTSGKDTLDKVAANRSGFLIRTSSTLQVIARFPLDALSRNRPDDDDPNGMVFAVANEFERGRALIMADHSVFINLMMFPADNQNLDFAFNCVDWLTDHGRRNRVLFLEEGRIRNTFEIPLEELPAPPLPPPEKLVAAFDQVMAGLERENRFNELISSLQASIPRDKALSMTILGLSCLLGLFALQRLSLARHRREAGIVPLAATVEKLELGRPIHELRTHALTERGNYWEAAHELAIDIFEPLLPSAGSGSRLHVVSTGSWWERWHWKRRVRAFWQLAIDPKPRRWSRRQWLGLHALNRPLRRALALGSISLAPASSVPLDAMSQDALPRFHSAR